MEIPAHAERGVTRIDFAYGCFLRATRPWAVVGLSFIAALALPFAHPSPEAPGFWFDVTLIVLSLAFGWRTRDGWRPVLRGTIGIATMAAYAAGSVALIIGASFIQGTFFASAAEVAASHASAPPMLLAIVIGPIAESLLFAGWIQTAIERTINVRVAFAVTALLFWASHLSTSAPLLVAVVALCYIRARTGSLGTVIVTHAALNASMYLLH